MMEARLPTYYQMIQGDNPLEINSESEHGEDVDISYDELTLFCQQILKKYDLLKKDNNKLKRATIIC